LKKLKGIIFCHVPHRDTFGNKIKMRLRQFKSEVVLKRLFVLIN